ncbi:hypothetical protein D1007_12349 [Hordeum vulgare]|nr:hypothetical protein D1007_12349 [Hordeum vulgare]
MELTRTHAVFSKIAMVLFLCRNKSSRNVLKTYGDFFWNKRKNTCAKIHQRRWTSGPQAHKSRPRHEGLWGPHGSTAPKLSSISSVSPGKIREKVKSRFAIRRRRHILFFIWRTDLESVSGSGEGKSSSSSSSTFLHRQFHDALHRS